MRRRSILEWIRCPPNFRSCWQNDNGSYIRNAQHVLVDCWKSCPRSSTPQTIQHSLRLVASYTKVVEWWLVWFARSFRLVMGWQKSAKAFRIQCWYTITAPRIVRSAKNVALGHRWIWFRRSIKLYREDPWVSRFKHIQWMLNSMEC